VNRLRALPAAFVLLLVAPGCTGPAEDAARESSDPTASVPVVPSPPPPTLAGAAEASALAGLPAGPASGTAVLAYSGIGEVRAAFTGSCHQDGTATRIEGSADTARLRLDVAPDGTKLTLVDVGLSATSALSTGRYEVTGRHLSLAAGLADEGQHVGSVELEVDCGG
jgi:hypothetical protein